MKMPFHERIKQHSDIVVAVIHILLAIYIYNDGVFLDKVIPILAPIALLIFLYYIYSILHDDIKLLQEKLLVEQRKTANTQNKKKPTPTFNFQENLSLEGEIK
jgi:hypothetical protein